MATVGGNIGDAWDIRERTSRLGRPVTIWTPHPESPAVAGSCQGAGPIDCSSAAVQLSGVGNRGALAQQQRRARMMRDELVVERSPGSEEAPICCRAQDAQPGPAFDHRGLAEEPALHREESVAPVRESVT